MSSTKILTIIGARPQFVKAAVVSRAVNESKSSQLQEIIVHTGQHYDSNMSDIFFEEMDIPKPHYHLGIGGSSHGKMTGAMISKIEEVLFKEKPDILNIYGDTNSTLAGAIAASKLHIPISHVEAGLRSFNLKMPEEINRILADRISTWLFCPTQTAVDNLNKEGFENYPCHIHNVGDVMYDAALYYKAQSKISPELQTKLDSLGDFYLCTIHRGENTDDPQKLSDIFKTLDDLASQKNIVLPLHPRTKKCLKENNITLKNITLIDPVGYFDMIALLDRCSGVITDSGGLQKEAYFFGKPCLTLREETEWVELITAKVNVLCGSNPEKIRKEFAEFLAKPIDCSQSLYGDGHAGEKIISYWS
ncbi:MAG: UDP-N-acetylglucosamine 2-epimerase (non-hydrolyzing) [Halobacteriovoraceae bacterium]|nr:UDP-N-acetylglucosamine 2-epimerase (non-hydrolyzing) [Halobacteriovoraceae bacterium]